MPLNHHHVLFEVGCEELPPQQIDSFIHQLEHALKIELQEASIAFDRIEMFSTPRRLALIVHNIAFSQSTKTQTINGPSCQLGDLIKEKFIKKLPGTLLHLTAIDDKKGKRWQAKIQTQALKTQIKLPEILTRIVTQLTYPRPMYWGEQQGPFVRPVRWVVLLFDQHVVAFELFGNKSKNTTHAHRVYTQNALPVTPLTYEKILLEHHVIANAHARKLRIKNSIEKQCQLLGATCPSLDEKFLNEIKNINEMPTLFQGTFHKDFLTLPKELLVTVMKHHQRYIPLEKNKHLLNHFLFFSNIAPNDPAQLIADNEKVLTARLADAQFFWTQDKKQPLRTQLPLLKNLQFIEGLGNYWDKTNRLIQSILLQCEESERKDAKDCVWLSQCDLLTQTVAEFPELQGIMGGYYAQEDNYNVAVCLAIQEQYQPKQLGDFIPTSNLGAKLALVQKIDHLFQVTHIAKKWPKGTKDPLAIRRNSLCVVQLLMQHHALRDRCLETLFCNAADSVHFARESIEWKPLMKWFSERIQTYLKLQFSNDLIAAVLQTDRVLQTPLFHFEERCSFLTQQHADNPAVFTALHTVHKRLKNLLKNEKKHPINSDLLDKTQNAIYKTSNALLKAQTIKEQFLHSETLGAILKQWLDENKIERGEIQEIRHKKSLLHCALNALDKIADFEKLHPTLLK